MNLVLWYTLVKLVALIIHVQISHAYVNTLETDLPSYLYLNDPQMMSASTYFLLVFNSERSNRFNKMSGV